MCIARYSLAVDRPKRRNGESTADFISCVAFGKSGEFAEQFLKKGMKIAVSGRIQTGSYTNKDGQKVYTTDVIVENHEFCERKRATDDEPDYTGQQGAGPRKDYGDGFMSIPDNIDEELPFS